MDEIEEGVVVDDRTPRLLGCHYDVTLPTIPADPTRWSAPSPQARTPGVIDVPDAIHRGGPFVAGHGDLHRH